jgi:hypothetical protein
MGNKIADKISLNALIEGFSNYVQTLRRILRHPFRFPESLETEGDDAFRNAFGFVIYSIALLFFLLVPVFSEHRAEVSKVTFVIRYLVQFAMYDVLMHFGLRFVGRSTKDLRATSVVYAYIVGVGAPLAIILGYPILLGFGPSALFGTADDLLRLESYYEAHLLLAVYASIVVFVLGVISIVPIVAWFPRTHQVTKVRVLLCLFLAGAVGGVIQILVLNPVFLVAFERIERWLKYA